VSCGLLAFCDQLSAFSSVTQDQSATAASKRKVTKFTEGEFELRSSAKIKVPGVSPG
jgi:hypothetical protein